MGTWYSTEWRKVEWNESTRADLKKYVAKYKPSMKSVPQARILLVGIVGAGKSSFFNSINSIFQGHITGQADAGDNETSLTFKYHTYKVKESQDGEPLSFLLCDTMGLETRESKGVKVKDIDSVLKGYIKDGYQFDPKKPYERPGNQTHDLPLKDRIHCVVFVVDASAIALMGAEGHQDIIKKLNEVKEIAIQLEIPRMVLLTKVDKACPHVGKNLKNVYWSDYLKDQIFKAGQYLGIQVANVFPVKNYSSENELDMCTDILLLAAMQKMLRLANDFFANLEKDTQ